MTDLINTEMDGKYLTFLNDNQLFGMPIADVVQIVSIQEITPVPEFPDFAKGVINLRGTVIPVIDMRIRLGKPEKEYDEKTCIIITMMQEKTIGFIVDSVDAVAFIEDFNISAPPNMAGPNANAYLTGIAKLAEKVVLLLDTTKIINPDMLSDIT